jgi:hypothetical protein
MRTDYVLYLAAVICFIIAGYYGYTYSLADMNTTLIVVVLAIIGVIFIWGGYSLRPQARVVTRAEPSMPPTKPAMEEQPIMPAPEPEPAPAPEPEPMPSPEITEETKTEEPPPPEAPQETPETAEETKKPVRKRREKKRA